MMTFPFRVGANVTVPLLPDARKSFVSYLSPGLSYHAAQCLWLMLLLAGNGIEIVLPVWVAVPSSVLSQWLLYMMLTVYCVGGVGPTGLLGPPFPPHAAAASVAIVAMIFFAV